MFKVFPEANGYQAIERTVGPEARGAIEKALPFRVHFNELGQHTLYVALRDKRPLGLVYARSEEGAWGLTDIEWGMTLDLKIVGFRFQRMRDPNKELLEGSVFARMLPNRGTRELKELLDKHGNIRAGVRGIPEGTEDTAAMLVRSGLKSLVVTALVWPVEVEKLRDLAIGMQAFPSACRFHRVWPSREGPPEPLGSARCQVAFAVRASDARDQACGLVAETEQRLDAGAATLRWTLSREGVVVSVRDVGGASTPELQAACRSARGLSLTDIGERESRLAEPAWLLLYLCLGSREASPK